MSPFLENDEHFLLMDIAFQGETDPTKYPLKPTQRYQHISDDGLRQLRDVGIRTTMPFQCIWNEIETAPGVYDWSYLDNYIERASKADMKVLLFTPTHGYPEWFPDSYFVKCADGIHREALSPWNPEAMAANLNFYRLMMERYSSPRCLLANAQLSVGETILLNMPAFYDDLALESFHKYADTEDDPDPSDGLTNAWMEDSYLAMLLEQQRILVENPNREIYLMLHPAIADMPFYGNGCNMISDVLREYHNKLAPVQINHIYYTWIQWQQYWPIMNYWRHMYGENVFGGGEYAEGLPITTPAAVANGLRGQIIAPCYPGIHDHVEPWMLDNIRAANLLWESVI